MDKKALRKEILVKRAEIDATYRNHASVQVTDTIVKHPLFIKAQCIASFVDFRDEMNMSQINQAILKKGKILVLPYISMGKNEMTFHVVTHLEALVKNNYGIFEPNPLKDEAVDIDLIDLILTPGVAFNAEGYRLGYGGGFYDRLFSHISKAIPKFGIAFDMQRVSDLPVESFDQPITHLITEKKIYVF